MGEELLEHHRPAILARALRLAGSSADAEDLTQETLLRAHKSFGELEDEKASLGWMLRILTRVHIDRMRRGDPLKAQTVDLESVELADPGPSGFVVVRAAEMSSCTRRYLDRLKPGDRRILELHDVEGYTAAEIASQLGISVGAAKIRLHRARMKLKTMLDEACRFSRDERGVFVCEPKREESR